MEDELPKIHLADCPEDLQALVRDVAVQFRSAATWPTINDVHVMRVEREIDEAPFIRHRYELFCDWSDEGVIRLRLNPWALHDAGGLENVFSDACRLVGKAFEEIRRTHQPAAITLGQAAKELSLPPEDIRLAHLAYVFERSYFGWQTSSEEGWKLVIDVSRLSKSPPSVEALFLQRPVSWQHRHGSIISLNGILGLGSGQREVPPPLGKRVFIVHGSDAGTKSEVARTVAALGLEPIVLHEQPNKGRTLVEKFEQYADVGFAIVILTPDDEGKRANDRSRPRRRARQNVVLELGFFWGRLGRERVCALVKGDIEKPSDYDGVVYVPHDDAGGWRLSLAKELRDCGYNVSFESL